jgi:hypothetical protein
MGKCQTGGDLAQVNFAQAPVVLACRTDALVTGFRIGTFIQND